MKRLKFLLLVLISLVITESVALLSNKSESSANKTVQSVDSKLLPDTEVELLSAAQKYFHDGEYEQTIRTYEKVLSLNFFKI